MDTPVARAAATDRPVLLRRALRLEYLTVGWNIVEGLVAIAAALAAGSVALLGFGIDSFVESASGSILIWRLLHRALRLEYLTVGWNIVEGLVAIAAAVAAGSVALLGFGIDSFVESASGSILIWRLLAERNADEDDEARIEHVERRAQRLVAASLVLLAAYITWDSVTSLIAGDRPEPSAVGIALAIASLVVMWWLARQKRRVGIALGSRAMTADAFQTDACFWLSVFLLVGIGANALFGWWWADPVAALAMVLFIGREALEAWRGEDDA